MARGLRSLVQAVIGLKAGQSEISDTKAALLQEVWQAHDDWRAALRYCDQVTDPTDIDFAIYQLKSAQQRYVNLCQEAKRAGIPAWDISFQEMVRAALSASNTK